MLSLPTSESHVPIFDTMGGGVTTSRSWKGDICLRGTENFEICLGKELTLHATIKEVLI